MGIGHDFFYWLTGLLHGFSNSDGSSLTTFLATFLATFCITFHVAFSASCHHGVLKNGTVHHVAVVGLLLFAVHLHPQQLLPGFLETRGVSIVGDFAGGQKVEPLFQVFHSFCQQS